MEQRYTSKATSINGKGHKVPRIFKHMNIEFYDCDTTCVDYGGGESDVVQEWLDEQGLRIKNLVIDKYNRSEEHNESVRNSIAEIGGADFLVLSNVLNVIAEKEVRAEVLRDACSLLNIGQYMYISVYEGDKSGIGRETKKDCWQNNMRLEDYAKEVEEALPNCCIDGIVDGVMYVFKVQK